MLRLSWLLASLMYEALSPEERYILYVQSNLYEYVYDVHVYCLIDWTQPVLTRIFANVTDLNER